ncbi:MAG: DNA polymerase IV [Coprothermobacterota bacterium]|nr:DNA polymerase IV [Coprothermobacterota bacterium]
MSPKRRILHMDMDAFFASVEELDDPSLRGRPVIVGGHNTKRGVVSAASYPARAFGVHSAMPLWQAKQLCPQAVFLPVRMHRYAEASRDFHRILEEYTPLVESMGFDEAYLDVTGSLHLFGTAEEIGHAIQDRIQEDVGLSCSVGLSYNKFLSKIASGWQKPHGFTSILEEDALGFLHHLPLGELPGVGFRTREKLAQSGLRTVRDLLSLPSAFLRVEFGKLGQDLLLYAQGIDPRPVVPDCDRKSMGSEGTFAEDLSDSAEMLKALLEISDSLAHQLRAEGWRTSRVTIKLRDPNFQTTTRAQTLKQSIDSNDDLFRVVRALFQKGWPKRVRLLGVSLSQLSRSGDAVTFPSFRETHQASLSRALDQIRGKYGEGTVSRASLFRQGEFRNRSLKPPLKEKGSRG